MNVKKTTRKKKRRQEKKSSLWPTLLVAITILVALYMGLRGLFQ